ncbi:uncharacterized protein LOC142646054 [Dermatophagoides pteronyssinus]|uniref:uncharacterized protein LOC142646054 n=1 Tax=Dermatophagoides pteronyssinus TaxID=6956 RepID=UPI003F67C6D4
MTFTLFNRLLMMNYHHHHQNNRIFGLISRNISNKFFHSKFDRYGGIHFETVGKTSSFDSNRLSEIINRSINNNNQQKDIRTIWFRITRDNVCLIEPLVKLGFDFHHTKNNNVIMVKSLNDRNNIPKYAYTNVGVGGLVINDKNQILIVKERTKITDYWKFPGGYVEQGEELSDAVVREVYEETGIQTKFQCILTIRHLHNVQWGFDCSDLYFVCHLRTINNNNNNGKDLNEIIKCPNEIDQCEWIDLEKVEEKLSKFNNFVIQKYIEWKDQQQQQYEIGMDRLKTNFPSPPLNEFCIYSIKEKL